MRGDPVLRAHVWWDVFYAVVAASVAAITATTDAAPHRRLLAIALIGAIAVLYVLIGRPIAYRPASFTRQIAFVVVLAGLYLALAATCKTGDLLLLALCPIVLSLDSFAVAAIAVVGLNSTTVAAAVITDLDVLDAAVLSAAVSAWSIVLGLWVRRIIAQSASRAEIIAELEASREEIARLSHEAGTAAERQRVAADIHDTLAQGFGSIVMLVQAVRHSIERGAPTVDEQLDLIERTARDNLAEARAIVTAMQPAALAAVTVEEAVRRLADDAELTVTGRSRELPPAVAVVLLRSCQEALTNIRKHSGATSVHIGLTYSEDAVALTVRDDGRGFDPAATAGGFGLSGMRGRATEVGGAMTVDSAPGRGTTIRVEVPA